jgi:hypothetical protein
MKKPWRGKRNLAALGRTDRTDEKKAPKEPETGKIISAAERVEADRLRAKKALDTRSILLAIAAVILLFGYMVPSAFGAPLPYYPIGLLVTVVYFILGATVAIVEARVAGSRVAIRRIAAGLALMGIFFVFLVVSPRVLPLEWLAPAFLTALVSVVAGFILFFAGWDSAHKALRQMAGEYAAHRGGMVWMGMHLTFEVRKYHFILVAGILGAFLLFLSSIITVNFVYAVGGFLYLVIFVIVAAMVKIRQVAEHC